jgi:hypothetical protein
MSLLPSAQSSTPAAKMTVVLTLVALYVALELVVWFTLVPGTLSAQTFAWVSILGLITTIAAISTMVGARATRSIAHVLYDTEHPASRLPKL